MSLYLLIYFTSFKSNLLIGSLMEKKKAPIIGLLLVIFLSLRQFSSTFVKKIKFQIVYQSYCKDHLHIRGENLFKAFFLFHFLGLPPHTWRKQENYGSSEVNSRITSTYVEKTPCNYLKLSSPQDHLHIRGENLHASRLNSS